MTMPCTFSGLLMPGSPAPPGWTEAPAAGRQPPETDAFLVGLRDGCIGNVEHVGESAEGIIGARLQRDLAKLLYASAQTLTVGVGGDVIPKCARALGRLLEPELVRDDARLLGIGYLDEAQIEMRLSVAQSLADDVLCRRFAELPMVLRVELLAVIATHVVARSTEAVESDGLPCAILFGLAKSLDAQCVCELLERRLVSCRLEGRLLSLADLASLAVLMRRKPKEFVQSRHHVPTDALGLFHAEGVAMPTAECGVESAHQSMDRQPTVVQEIVHGGRRPMLLGHAKRHLAQGVPFNVDRRVDGGIFVLALQKLDDQQVREAESNETRERRLLRRLVLRGPECQLRVAKCSECFRKVRPTRTRCGLDDQAAKLLGAESRGGGGDSGELRDHGVLLLRCASYLLEATEGP